LSNALTLLFNLNFRCMSSKKQISMEQQLVARLANPNIEKSLLKATSGYIAEAYAKGVKWDDYFPLGKPKPEGFAIKGRVAINNISRLKGLVDSKYLDKLEIFPRGIINPEYLEVIATFNNHGY
ncbi:MAG: hypothetical protein AAGK97_14780, partial [Bacteroidota bacterium]